MTSPAVNHVVYQAAEDLPLEWPKENLDTLEPLLARNPCRFVLLPIKYLAIWRAYKHTVSTFWIADSIEASDDVVEWQKTCTDTDRRVVGSLLLLLETTGKMHESLFCAVSATITSPEARCFFGFQGMIENVHREAIAALAVAFLPYHGTGEGSPVKVDSMKSFERKLQWIQAQTDNQSTSFSKKILLLLFIQGLCSASTAAIFRWVSEKDVLQCLVYTYNKIAIDRETHVNFATLLFYHLERCPSAKYAERLVSELVEIECSFAEELIRNIDAEIPLYTVLRDIECVADSLLVSAGYQAIYGKLENKGELDRKITGKLKAMYFQQEMATAYMQTISDKNYAELSFDFIE